MGFLHQPLLSNGIQRFLCAGLLILFSIRRLCGLKLSRRLSRFSARAQFLRSRRQLFRKIFRGLRGKLSLNDVTHDYLNAFLLSICFRRCFHGSTLAHSFRGAFARAGFAFAEGSPHESRNTNSLHGGF